MYWAADAYYRPFGFDDAFRRRRRALGTAQASETDEPTEMPSPARAIAAIEAFRSEARPDRLIRDLAATLRRSLMRWLHARLRHTARVGYRTDDTLAAQWRLWLWKRRALTEKRPAVWSPDQPYIFFGLHFEPESSLMAEAPMADNQLALIDMLAKTIPAGWVLAVKEHPGATATRPSSFWRQTRRYPNVFVAPVLDDAMSLMNGASAVATINGTLGLQAAVAGIPAITFHPNFVGLVLPHVLYVDSYATCQVVMRRIRDRDFPALPALRRLGSAFLGALDDCAFEVSDAGLILGAANKAPIGSQDLQRIVDTFIASVTDNVTGTASQVVASS